MASWSKASFSNTIVACIVLMLTAHDIGSTAITPITQLESQHPVGNILRAAKTPSSGRTVVVHVTYDYSTNIAFSVKARVHDSFDFILPWPTERTAWAASPTSPNSLDPSELELEFENFPSQVTDVRDARKGCAPPEVLGPFERMQVTRVAMAGALIKVEGYQTVPDARIGRLADGCAILDQIRPGTSKSDFIATFIPPAVFDATSSAHPQVARGIGTGGEWVWTFTPQ